MRTGMEKTLLLMSQLSLCLLLSFSMPSVAASQQALNWLNKAKKDSEQYRHCDVALKEAEQAIFLEPTLVEAYVVKARCVDFLTGADAAIPVLKQALQIDKNCFEATKMLGEMYDAKRDFRSAIVYYSAALAGNPIDLDVRHQRALAYIETKQNALAIADLDTCVEQFPQKYLALEWRAFAYEHTHQWDKAIADLNKAIAISQNHESDLIGHRADLYLKAGKLKEALKDYSTLIERNGLDETLWLKRGDCRMAMQDYKGAVQDYTGTIELNDSETAYFSRSKAYEKLGLQPLADKDRATAHKLSRRKIVAPL